MHVLNNLTLMTLPEAALATTTPCHTTRHAIELDGRPQTYLVHRPCCATGALDSPRPLVIMLHGWTEQAASYAGFEGQNAWNPHRDGADRWAEEAERGCFYVVWLQAEATQLGHYGRYPSWNAGGCSVAGPDACLPETQAEPLCSETCQSCGACAWCSCVDHVDIITHLTLSVRESDLGIDGASIFLAGCSNGGMMTWDMALRGPRELFAGFAPNCGLPHPGYLCVPPRPLHVLHIHAQNDHTIPIDGSPSAGGYIYESAAHALAAAASGATCETFVAEGEGSAPEWKLGPLAERVGGLNGSESEQDPAELAWLSGVSLASGRPLEAAIERHDRCQLHTHCSGASAERARAECMRREPSRIR